MPSNAMIPGGSTGEEPRRPAGSAPRPAMRVTATGKKGSKQEKSLMRTAAGGFFAQQTVSLVSKQAFDQSGNLTPTAENWLTRAVTVQRPLVLANLRRLRKKHPTLSNRQMARELDKEFLRVMTGSGAAIGATAAVPAVGTVAALGLSAFATGGFLETSAVYAQSIAELSGISTEEPERAQYLVMAVMLGEEGRKLLGELSEQVDGRGIGPYSSLVPLTSLAGSTGVGGTVANQLKRHFIRRFFFRQGTSMFARAIPFGIGAVVGGAANRMLAKQIVTTAHRTFGDLPEETPQALIEDMRRALDREKLRADRRERRDRKKELRGEQKAARQDRREEISGRRRQLKVEEADRRVEKAQRRLEKAQQARKARDSSGPVES